jgi:hypothetical protein
MNDACKIGRTHNYTDGRHSGMHASLLEAQFQARKLDPSMLARSHTSGTARLAASIFAFSYACIRHLRLASKRSLTHASIHTRLDTRLHAHIRTDRHSFTYTGCKLRILERRHMCPQCEYHVRFNKGWHACKQTRHNPRIYEQIFDGRRHL